MDEDRRIAVSPRHEVLLVREYAALIDRPPARDFVVRTVMRREVNGLVLMTAELVIAGEETQKAHPLATTYPLHFRKTYFPGQLHGDPKDEFDSQALACELGAAVPPIGFGAKVFRSCLVPGQPYARLSPFGVEPAGMNIPLAEKLAIASAVGLWRLMEQALCHHRALHDGGLAHGDAELHNCIVSPAPLELVLIDFGSAVRRQALGPDAWTARRNLDLAPLLREAVFLQCSLGRQVGPLAELSWDRAEELFGAESADRFRRQIEQRQGI